MTATYRPSTLSDPVANPETAMYWKAFSERRFLVPQCEECGKHHWYPRAHCPFCYGAVIPKPSQGTGQIYSFSVIGQKDSGPYVLAYIELDEGPRLLSNIVTDDVATLVAGTPVRVEFEPSPNGQLLPVFRPYAQKSR